MAKHPKYYNETKAGEPNDNTQHDEVFSDVIENTTDEKVCVTYDNVVKEHYDIWSDIETAPKDGTNIMVSPDKESESVAYWRATRAREGGQWKPSGRWTNPLTHYKLDFEPKYWREYNLVVESNADIIAADKVRIAQLEKELSEARNRK